MDYPAERKCYIHLADDILTRFPELCVMGFRVDVIDDDALAQLEVPDQAVVEAALRDLGVSVASLADHELVAEWRSATRASGLKPSTFKSSPEALARRFAKGSGLSTPLQLVNLYCAVSAMNLAPLGAYDIRRLPGSGAGSNLEIDLRLAKPGSDRFVPIGGKPSDFPITPEVPIYACDDTIICWSFNCRDSSETCLVDNSSAMLFLGEATTANQREALEQAIAQLHDLLSIKGILTGEIVSVSGKEPKVLLPALEP